MKSQQKRYSCHFLKETADFSEHPAELFRASSIDTTVTNDKSMMAHEDRDDAILIERTGVADPECVQLSGRSFTASALRNLASLATGSGREGIGNDSNQPDLAIHHGAAAVSE
jgi:hypothetical protein